MVGELESIVAYKREEIAGDRLGVSLETLKSKIKQLPPTRNFKAAISEHNLNLIAEIKRASPSKGLIRKEFDPPEIAKIYQDSGASAISVLTTEKFFRGSLDFLSQVSAVTTIPILQKDFVVDEYQIYQARVNKADAILLIASILVEAQIKNFLECAHSLGLACLVEIHTKTELAKVLATKAQIIGINNRNLTTLTTDLETTLNLSKLVPQDRILVSESGIGTREDVKRLQECGVRAVLVGESLMRSSDIGVKTKELLGEI
jgi:indole-3-glycerol phosphate synthase